MKNFLSTFAAVAALVLAGCSDILDPMPNGGYNEDNLKDYPSMIRGFVIKAYSLLPNSYNGTEYAYLECATDNAVARDQSHAMRRLATGSLSPGDDPFAAWWGRDYEGIYYVNRFLENDLGLNTRYYVNPEIDEAARRLYQGEAYALRAWYQYDLLRKFGGRSADGELLGFPIVTSPRVGGDLVRDSYDRCVAQILSDCDKALEYLPQAHRDVFFEDQTVSGSMNWHRFDGISMVALKAMTCLMWASPAFNPQGDLTRWEKAAEYAAEAMKYKLEVDGAQLEAFDPKARFSWSDPDSPEIICSSSPSSNANMETLFYPNGFHGTGAIGVTQELVDAFPMANGYPIGDPAGGYDENAPYAGRDPRFYVTVFHHGSEVVKSNGKVQYTFDMSAGGRDVANSPNNSPTNYYVRKFLYSEWNKSDITVQTAARSVAFMRWTHMCLAFAEAANRVVGPLDATRFGYSARQAVGFLRSRRAGDGKPGVGAAADHYLDACAARGKEAFETLVRNERRIELCFEGERFFDLRRWSEDVSALNGTVSKAVVGEGTYAREQVENRVFASRWLPIPSTEIRRSPKLVQNEGWTAWN